METASSIQSNVEIKRPNDIDIKQTNIEVCENRIEMPFKELIAHLSKNLMGYAMSLSNNDYDQAWDLIQITMEKLMNNKEKRMVSIEANDIPVINDGFQEQSAECQEMLKCIEGFNEPDKTILTMLGLGNSYEEIHEVIGDISMGNLRVKANRARQDLANCMGKKL